MNPTGAVRTVKPQILTGHPSISALSFVRNVQVISDELCSSPRGGRLALTVLCRQTGCGLDNHCEK